MGVVIGFGTIANLNGYCAANVSWGANPNTQRLYCLDGSFSPFLEIDRPTVNVSMTIYGTGPHIDVTPSNSCTTQDQVAEADVNISPTGCGDQAAFPPINYRMVINSYSVSKEDARMPPQSSFGMIRWTGVEPDVVIRGISEGSGTVHSGIQFEGTTTTSTQGSVSAGGVGRADVITLGAVRAYGGVTIAAGQTARGDVSTPHTPMWI